MGRMAQDGLTGESQADENLVKLKKNFNVFHWGRRSYISVLCLLSAAGVIVGCSGAIQKSPRKVVIELFGAMASNDRPLLANVLDIPSLLEPRQLDYALNLDTARLFTSPKQVFDDLTFDGLTKQTWFKYQRVVGDEEIVGDTAYVEVSFVDKNTGQRTFNKFGVRKIGQRWLIYSFRTLVAPQ